MNRIFCVDVGTGSICPARLVLSCTVNDLKKIQEARPNAVSFDPTRLKLYLAKRGDSWLATRDIDRQALRRSEIPETIRALMHDEMVGTRRLDDPAYFGMRFESGDHCVHVLVEFPIDPYNARWTLCRLALQYLFMVAVVVAIAALFVNSQSPTDRAKCRADGTPRFHCDGADIWGFSALGIAFFLLGFARAVLEVKICHAYRRWGFPPDYGSIV